MIKKSIVSTIFKEGPEFIVSMLCIIAISPLLLAAAIISFPYYLLKSIEYGILKYKYKDRLITSYYRFLSESAYELTELQ